MPDSHEPKYDVAFSFLNAHRGLATALARALAPLSCFVFSERQQEVAGTNGPETYSRIFKKETRLAVVLHSAGYAASDYTMLENLAIQELAFETAFEGVLLVKLDDAEPPLWFPRRVQLYFDHREYSVPELVGVIKSRVAERGGKLTPETLVDREKRLAAARQIAAEREERLYSPEALNTARDEIRSVFRSIDSKVAEIRENVPDIPLSFYGNTRADLACYVSNPKCSMSVWWDQPYANTVRDAVLAVEYFNGGFSFEYGVRYMRSDTHQIGRIRFEFCIADDDTWAWREQGKGDPVSGDLVAERALKELLDRIRAPQPKRRQPPSGPGFVNGWR